MISLKVSQHRAKSTHLINILKYFLLKSKDTAVNYNACELLISYGSIYTVKLMQSNNSELITSDLSVNFNWPPEECNCSFFFSFKIHWATTTGVQTRI